MSGRTVRAYRDSTRLTLSLIAVLAIFVVLAEVGIWSTFLEIALLERALAAGHVYANELTADENRRAFVGGLQLLVFVLAAGLFLRWIHTMNANAHALSASGMRFGPGASVAWFFVPVVQFWKPLDVLRELFRASHPDHIEDWQAASVPHLLSLWWTLWLCFLLTSVLALQADVWAVSYGELYAAAWGTAVAGVVAAPLGVAAAVSVWRLHAWQRARFRATAPMRIRQPWPTRTGEDPAPIG
ncbi:MAG TPA: DUF4328 domain-containing protein [Gemmatimonadota bacterium]|nr:DUF4328 domain-containing protein [Gemmatimonadota bacterium]